MNFVFLFLIVVSIVFSFVNGTTDKLVTAMLDSCNLAVKVAFSLIGIMTFWLGIMRIADKSGLVCLISKIISPLLQPLFKGIHKDSPVFGNVAMSLTANAFGLTNAATPIGIKVMENLQEENSNKTVATDEMCMFLAMNTAGFQIIPATVIAILVGLGAKNPTEIVLPTLIVTTLSFFISVGIAYILSLLWRKAGEEC